MQMQDCKLGTTAPNGMWAGNLQRLAESAAHPKRLGEALFASWVQGSTAISTSWSIAALGLAQVDPGTGAWGSVTASPPNGVESGSQGVHDLGPWSMSTRQPNAVESGSQGAEDLGPWSSAGHPHPHSALGALQRRQALLRRTGMQRQRLVRLEGRGVIER